MPLSLMRRTAVRTVLWYSGLLKPKTQTTVAERAALARHAAGRHCLVEIGVYNGVTTLELRKVMAPNGVLWAVDPFSPGRLGFCLDEKIARHTVEKSANGAIVFVRVTGAQAASCYVEQNHPPVDFVFIDGDHSWAGIDADWKGWSPLVAPAGILALHDSRSYPGNEVRLELDSVRYFDQVIRLDTRFKVIDQVDTLTVLQAS